MTEFEFVRQCSVHIATLAEQTYRNHLYFFVGVGIGCFLGGLMMKMWIEFKGLQKLKENLKTSEANYEVAQENFHRANQKDSKL